MIFPATDETIARAAALLASGQLVGMPTETVYGLAANAWDGAAVRKIFAAKSRPTDNPLIVHVASVDRLSDAMRWPPSSVVQKQLDSIIDLWPGPLTIVCERSSRVPDEVTAGRSTVAVRIPAHDVALALLEACDFPIAAPSANRSKYVSPTQADHFYGPSGVAEHVAMIIDGGPCQWGVESTIVKLGEPGPRLLRPGAISLQVLADRFSVRPEVLLEQEPHDGLSLLAPGMMKEHYCPSTKLVLLDPSALFDASNGNHHLRIGRIAFNMLTAAEAERYAVVETLSSSGDLREVAHHLFAAIRRLDAEGLDAIHCDTCESQGMGHAIMDRLKRAAAKSQS